MTEAKNCSCGEDDCWDADDSSWLSSNSGWHGDINGCPSSVFFIHGKRIREQRHIPVGDWPVADMVELVRRWSEGLPGARLVMSHDTGGGEPGFWIEGVREPNAADMKRLEECRARQEEDDRITYARLKRKYAGEEGAPPPS